MGIGSACVCALKDQSVSTSDSTVDGNNISGGITKSYISVQDRSTANGKSSPSKSQSICTVSQRYIAAIKVDDAA